MQQNADRMGMATIVALVAVALLGAPTSSAGQALETREAIQEFLLTAEIVAARPVGTGVTNPWRLTLSDGTITHDAHFQPVNIVERMRSFENRVDRPFIDSYRYNIAAYRLADLLGLGEMVPVTVERTWDDRKGSLSWWIDDVMFDEDERLRRQIEPPDITRWNEQLSRMLAFSELIQDGDRNQGNIIHGEGWHLWMIDFSRGFRRNPTLLKPTNLMICDRALYERLGSLTEDEVRAATDPYLRDREIETLMARRDAILAHFDQMIMELGVDAVLF